MGGRGLGRLVCRVVHRQQQRGNCTSQAFITSSRLADNGRSAIGSWVPGQAVRPTYEQLLPVRFNPFRRRIQPRQPLRARTARV